MKSGKFIVEDNYGVTWSRHDTLEEAEQEAERLQEKYAYLNEDV